MGAIAEFILIEWRSDQSVLHLGEPRAQSVDGAAKNNHRIRLIFFQSAAPVVGKRTKWREAGRSFFCRQFFAVVSMGQHATLNSWDYSVLQVSLRVSRTGPSSSRQKT